jgi:hypothetical protein
MVDLVAVAVMVLGPGLLEGLARLDKEITAVQLLLLLHLIIQVLVVALALLVQVQMPQIMGELV